MAEPTLREKRILLDTGRIHSLRHFLDVSELFLHESDDEAKCKKYIVLNREREESGSFQRSSFGILR